MLSLKTHSLVFFLWIATATWSCDMDSDPTQQNPNESENDPNLVVDFQRILADHNQARTQVSMPALSWNPALASSSQRWADQCMIQHDTSRDFNGEIFGENIASGSLGFTVEQLGKLWIDEEIDFWNCQENSCSKDPCGHYTQIIWDGTKELGCASALCGNQNFLVCRYLPAGNVKGQRPIPVNNCQP